MHRHRPKLTPEARVQRIADLLATRLLSLASAKSDSSHPGKSDRPAKKLGFKRPDEPR